MEEIKKQIYLVEIKGNVEGLGGLVQDIHNELDGLILPDNCWVYVRRLTEGISLPSEQQKPQKPKIPTYLKIHRQRGKIN